jgi:RHS repeat-associated protein
MSHLSRDNTPAGPRSWTGSLIQNKRDLTGLLYMRNRYYDPQTGRFTQEDPIGLAGGLNAYGFADGDPVSYSDPHGLFTCLGDPGCPKEFSSVQTFSRTFGVDAAFLPFGGNAQVGFAIDTNGQSSLFATAGPTMDFGIDAGFQLSGQDRPVSEVAATFNRSNEFTFTYTVGAASGSAIVDMEPGKLVGVAVGPRGGLALQMSQTAIGVATRPRNIAEENRKTCRELRRFLCFGSRL